MSFRKALLVHQWHTRRDIIKKFILSELSDVMIMTTDSGENALELLQKEKFDFLVCDNEMRGIEGIAVHGKMVTQTINKNTAFILITSSLNDENIEKFSVAGISHVLAAPFSAKSLAEMINKACDPRDNRLHRRVSINGVNVTLHCSGSEMKLEAVNISTGGLLAESDYAPGMRDLFGMITAHIDFPEDLGGDTVTVDAHLLRMSVLSWKDPNFPERIRVALKFLTVGDTERDILEAFLQREGIDKDYTGTEPSDDFSEDEI